MTVRWIQIVVVCDAASRCPSHLLTTWIRLCRRPTSSATTAFQLRAATVLYHPPTQVPLSSTRGMIMYLFKRSLGIDESSRYAIQNTNRVTPGAPHYSYRFHHLPLLLLSPHELVSTAFAPLSPPLLCDMLRELNSTLPTEYWGSETPLYKLYCTAFPLPSLSSSIIVTF